MDAAERDALVGVEVPSPVGGEPFVFRPLPYHRARYWWGRFFGEQAADGGMWAKITKGRIESGITLEGLDAFAAEVETLDGTKLRDLPFNVAEVSALAGRFLAHIRPGWSPWPAGAETEAEAPPSSTS